MLSGNRELKPVIPADSRLKCGEEKNMDKNARQSPAAEVRLTSLDFFRGLTMFMLIGEATGLYELLREPALNPDYAHDQRFERRSSSSDTARS